jgi:hypothetical protein
MSKLGYIDPDHWRAFSMTARLFAQYCEQNGLACIAQELVNWGSKRMIDSFSLFTRIDSPFARPNRVIENPEFMKEAESIRRWAHVYTLSSFSPSA